MKKLKKKKIVILLALLLLCAIGGGVYYVLQDKEPEIVTKKEEKKEEPKVQIVDVNTTSRPFAVMINNISTARPLQSGLQDAYLMYEIIVEGGITRYLALFLDTNTERIGSIRSARHYYLDYALENDAFYCHHGQSPQAQRDFSALKVDRIEVSDKKTGWRDKTLKVSSEHTLFTSIEKLKSGIGSKRTERNNDLLLNYSAKPIDLSVMENSSVANQISIKYSNNTTTSYIYNSDEQVYNKIISSKI